MRRSEPGQAPAGRHAESQFDWVAVEEPLEIRLVCGPAGSRRQVPVCITMRTPGDDPALALGFLFSEGIIRAPTDLLASPSGEAAVQAEGANAITVGLRPDLAVDLDRLHRHVVTSSACGVCGKSSLESLRVQAPYPVPAGGIRVTAAALATLPGALAARQPVFRETGGLHAAALFAADGTLLDAREDVGRHNALDKLIGAAFRAGRLPLAEAGLLVSGRASFEILQKARMAGCPLVAAVGAPSSLAVEVAREEGMSLIGFLRAGHFNVYAGPSRVAGHGPPRQ